MSEPTVTYSYIDNKTNEKVKIVFDSGQHFFDYIRNEFEKEKQTELENVTFWSFISGQIVSALILFIIFLIS